jgi:glycosyltransferase involved in cell wall biosynthesis
MTKVVRGNTEVLVSVCVITYNHKNYISQCLDSALMQQTKFPFEIILGEDESSDGTREICIEYAKEHSNKIRLFLHSRKNVIYINGTATGRYNLTEILKASRGKYIAICEGDDYWTDPLKLQKQVDFLEQNPDYAISFHNARILNEDSPRETFYSNPPDQVETTSFEDLAMGEYIYTATCMFRNENFKKFPKQFYTLINNYTLDLHNAQYGKIRYINEVMSVYRKHSGGIWSMVSREKTLMNQMPVYKFYVNYFEQKYKSYFIGHLQNMTSELMSIMIATKNYRNFWRFYKDFVFYNFDGMGKIKRVVYVLLRASYDMVRQTIN